MSVQETTIPTDSETVLPPAAEASQAAPGPVHEPATLPPTPGQRLSRRLDDWHWREGVLARRFSERSLLRWRIGAAAAGVALYALGAGSIAYNAPEKHVKACIGDQVGRSADQARSILSTGKDVNFVLSAGDVKNCAARAADRLGHRAFWLAVAGLGLAGLGVTGATGHLSPGGRRRRDFTRRGVSPYKA